MSGLADWPALVLTAGLGTRLRPLSTVRAKAALPVAGETLIRRILRWLQRAGVTQVVLNLHHRADSVTREVGDGSQWGLRVRYSWEWPLLGSAGGPARALPLIGADRFLVVNGDMLTDVDLATLTARHLATGALVTMALAPGDTSRYNGVDADADGVVRGFVRVGDAARGSAGHFIGVQAVNAAAFAGVACDQPSETVKALYPTLIQTRPRSVRAFWSDAEYLDIGTPRDYLETAIRIAGREGTSLDRGERCDVEPGAHLERTVLWDDVTVRAGASLTECVVADGVVVPTGARFERSSLVMAAGGLVSEPF